MESHVGQRSISLVVHLVDYSDMIVSQTQQNCFTVIIFLETLNLTNFMHLSSSVRNWTSLFLI